MTIQIPKNIIFMIADGMSVSLVSAYREFKNSEKNFYRNPCIFNEFLVGQLSTYSFDKHETITDSAAASTAMATGTKTYNGYVGLDINRERVSSAIEIAKENGKRTGLVVTSEISHATPAGFGAHVVDRTQYFDIADQYFDETIHNEHKIDVMLGGGRAHFIRDDRNLAAEFSQAGYDIVHTKSELSASDNPRILGLFSEYGLPMAIDRNTKVTPNLADMVESAIERLNMPENESGFFLMVEGSQIDWAAHHHDIVSVMSEIDDFASAFDQAVTFAKANGETLVIATADHATGGMTMGVEEISNWAPDYIQQLKKTPERIASQIYTSNHWEEVVNENIGFSLSTIEARQIYAAYKSHAFSIQETLARITDAIREIIDRRSNTGWTTGGHTGEDVNIYAYGPSSQAFAGWRENSTLGKQLKSGAADNSLFL